MTNTQTDYLAIPDVATKLNVSYETVRRWCFQGKLKSLRAGKQWRIRPRDLAEFLNVQTNTANILPKGIDKG